MLTSTETLDVVLNYYVLGIVRAPYPLLKIPAQGSDLEVGVEVLQAKRQMQMQEACLEA